MLADQEYGGHVSIHDDAMAQKLGLSAGPIEGPTHFSQFIPLFHKAWGQAWFETGCLSAHFQNMAIEGEEVKVSLEISPENPNLARIDAQKKDGTPVLTGTASVGSPAPESALEARMKKLRPYDQLVILRDLSVGDRGAAIDRVKMDFDQHFGALYPFTLNDKLAVITENSAWYSNEDNSSPWGQAIVPFEMISVLCEYTSRSAKWPIRQPTVGLFADLEIRIEKGPLLVGKEYLIEREIVAMGESRRTEGYWVKATIRDGATEEALGHSLLHHAIMKDSYPNYQAELQAATAAK